MHPEWLVHTAQALIVAGSSLLVATYVLPYFTRQEPSENVWHHYFDDDSELDIYDGWPENQDD